MEQKGTIINKEKVLNALVSVLLGIKENSGNMMLVMWHSMHTILTITGKIIEFIVKYPEVWKDLSAMVIDSINELIPKIEARMNAEPELQKEFVTLVNEVEKLETTMNSFASTVFTEQTKVKTAVRKVRTKKSEQPAAAAASS